MKRLILFGLTIAAVIVFLADHLAAQDKRSYKYENFNEIDAGWGMFVNIIEDDNYSIEIEGDGRDLSELKVIKKGNALVFSFDKPDYKKINDITVNIKMPVLKELNLGGGSRGIIDMDIDSKGFEAELSGGSKLEGELQCGDVSIGCSGASSVTLKGEGENFTAEGSGESIYNMKDFSVDNVNAGLSGGSSITITTNGTINSDQSGGSAIIYYGNAKIGNTDFSGGSGISKGNY
jgi:hypothetical protein